MKENQLHSFEEQWRNAFDDASMTPPDSVWGGIEAQLGDTAPLPQTGSGLPFYYIGGLAGVLLLGIGAYFFFEEKEVVNPKPKTVQIIEEKLDKASEVVAEQKVLIPEQKAIRPNIVQPKIKQHLEANPVIENPQEEKTQVTDNQIVEIKKELPENIEPLTSKSIKTYEVKPMEQADIQPKDTTAYYIKPKPQPKKETIWEKVKKNVKVSGGVGVYHQN
jgi:LPXTG-motif cell wall-anchored protein